MTLFLISWFAFSYSFPMNVNIGIRHDISSTLTGAERIMNADGVYLVRVSRIANGRLKPLKLEKRISED